MCSNYWSPCSLESALCNEKSPQWEACTLQLEKACTQQQTQSSQQINVCVCVCVPSGVQLFVIQWTVARQAPLCVGFSTQEYWSGLPFSTPGDLPNPGTEPTALASLALAGRFFTNIDTYEAHINKLINFWKQRKHAKKFKVICPVTYGGSKPRPEPTDRLLCAGLSPLLS